MTSTARASTVSVYDEVPFPSLAYPLTHPARLAAIARLCGLTPAPAEKCRVLELGCGAAGNLLPMAAALPDSQFVGVDLSEQQIGLGRGLATRASLPNVRLEVADLLTWEPGPEPFDFILAHGVFSWTTDEVREQILRLCRRLLAPWGIACVNFNTYPAWHVQGMLREMLVGAVTPDAGPSVRVASARKILRFLRQTLPTNGSPHAALLRAEIDQLDRQTDAFLFHAYLNVVNRPFLLSEFQRLAANHGLRYVGDAEFSATWPEWTHPAWEGPLREVSANPADWSQLADFSAFTTSRRSLLMAGEVDVERGPCWSTFESLHFSANLRSESPTGTSATFVAPDGQRVVTPPGSLSQALELLATQWPASIAGAELRAAIAGSDHPTGVVERSEDRPAELELGRWWRDLFQCCCRNLIQVTASASPAPRRLPSHPRATQLARLQATEQELVVNLRHQPLRLSAEDRAVLQLADGSHSVDQLESETRQPVQVTVRRLHAASLLQ